MLDGPNAYTYAKNSPTIYIDQDGNLAFTVGGTIVGVGTLAGGVFEVIAELRKPGDEQHILAAFGRGCVTGFAGTITFLAATAHSVNPFLAGAATGAVMNVVDGALEGKFSTEDYIFDVVTSSATAGVAKFIPGLKTIGRKPSLLKIRNSFKVLGKNSYRLFGQETVSSSSARILRQIIKESMPDPYNQNASELRVPEKK